MAVNDIVTLSLSSRILVNVEALNMAESVGNVTRHRRAPVIIYSNGKYSVVYVPAVSGESIAHHYQKLLADISKSMGLPVTDMDVQGYFLKFASNKIIESWYPDLKHVTKEKTDEESICRVETTLVKASVVADVGGFLYTDKLVKRTSRIRFSYLIPALDAISSGAAASYPQLHVRYTPPWAVEEQIPYYVESGSALYTLSAVLVASDIAKLEYCREQSELVDEKVRRVEAALKALIALMDGMTFGAKRSRYTPVWDVRSIMVSVSRGPIEFAVSPAANREYFRMSAERAKHVSEKLGLTVKLFTFDGEGIGASSVPGVDVELCNTHTEALSRASSLVIQWMKGVEG